MNSDDQRWTHNRVLAAWAWAEPLHDHRRAERLVATAARHLRRRLNGPESGRPAPPLPAAIVEDRTRGELRVPGRDITIRLAGLAVELAAVEDRLWTDRVATFIDRAVTAGDATAGIRIGRWADVEHRLVARVVPGPAASALAAPLGPDLAIDIGIALRGDVGPTDDLGVVAMATPTADHRRSWGRTGGQLWSAARANTRRLVRPTATSIEVDRVLVTLLEGGLD
ncbi:MAG: hypothetical protein ACR2QK_13220, partial [Acidimicrobiales bacterium]